MQNAYEEKSLITEEFLMDRVGPAPTVARVATFLEEAVSTTWRRLKQHQIQALKGAGTTRINLRSLVAFLNAAEDYQMTYKRGKKPLLKQFGEKRVLEKQEATQHISPKKTAAKSPPQPRNKELTLTAAE